MVGRYSMDTAAAFINQQTKPAMSYTEFTKKTVFNKRGKPPVIRIESGHTARINFSVEAVKLLGLYEGMKIAFRIYPHDKLTAYFYEQATGIPLAKEKNRTKTGPRLRIYCRPLAKELLNHFGIKDESKTFLLNAAQVIMPETAGHAKAWIIEKEKIHKPLNWIKSK